MLDRIDYCIGWIGHQNGQGGQVDSGVSGRCCCGLHWDTSMPPHDSEGRLIPPYVIERVTRRNGRRLRDELRRQREVVALRALGKPVPYPVR